VPIHDSCSAPNWQGTRIENRLAQGESTSHENGGRLPDGAIWQACLHRTTQLNDRREDRITLDEVVKINIRR